MYTRIFGMMVVSATLIGCGRGEPAKNAEKPAIAPGVVVAPPPAVKLTPNDATPLAPLFAAVDPNREKYDAALTQALNFLAERKYPQALEAFETAKSLKDDPFVRGEIDRLKSRMEQDASAQKTVHEIETVLAQGKASDASVAFSRMSRSSSSTDCPRSSRAAVLVPDSQKPKARVAGLCHSVSPISWPSGRSQRMSAGAAARLVK